MRDLKSRVAYLQGLSAGMNIEAESREGRILSGIIEVLDEFAQAMKEIEISNDHLEDYLESIDEDLFHLEEDVYRDSEDNPEEGEYLEVDCPRCGETVCFDSDILEEDDTIEVTCPNCDEVVFINDDNYHTVGETVSLTERKPADDEDF